MQVKRQMKEKGLTEMKGPIVVNFKRGGGQKIIRSRMPRSLTFEVIASPLNM